MQINRGLNLRGGGKQNCTGQIFQRDKYTEEQITDGQIYRGADLGSGKSLSGRFIKRQIYTEADYREGRFTE